jgi:hypothetical protein
MHTILKPQTHIYAPVLSGFVLALDSFTGTDNTLLENHTPEKGGVWTCQAGSSRIISNKLKCTASGPYTQNLGRADLVLEADYTVDTSGYTGFAYRFVDTNNYFYVWAHNNGYIYLYEKTAGTPTLRTSLNVGHSAGDNLHLRLALLANAHTFAVSGDHTGQITYSSAVRNTTAIHGLDLNSLAPQDGRLDNYIATK